MQHDSARTFVVYLVLIAIGFLGAGSDAVLNQWARVNRIGWLVAAYASWLVVATLLGLILRWQYFTFSAAVVVFLLANSVAAIVLDYRLFSGRLSAWEWAGIVLAMLAMSSIELGRAHSHADNATRDTPPAAVNR